MYVLRFETDRFAPENAELLETVLRCYYRLDDEGWKQAALEKSTAIYERTLAGLKDWADDV